MFWVVKADDEYAALLSSLKVPCEVMKAVTAGREHLSSEHIRINSAVCLNDDTETDVCSETCDMTISITGALTSN